ncbi:CinA family protein [Catenisphaera adipataccumulans]|uniref:PncC family amidohydrolase n=1 Tax=Catenisphaera adipataccumulans TaxID=700500 RepID=A0A7W8CYH0_9FIRM|nr:CinA family protein [Catenisphaera adipataccumulans]MBB5182270.1 PncC family amidohydrolase [Catenisphaera adipataccumulans]
MDTIKELITICTAKHCTISSCESLTAGLFTSAVASVPGASAVLKGGVVTYFTELKEKLVHVPAELVHTYGAVSEECAAAMARNTRELTDSDYCVSFTGNAGPDTMEGKPAGRVYCAIASKRGVKPFMFQCDAMTRNEVRQYVVDRMAEELLKEVKENG